MEHRWGVRHSLDVFVRLEGPPDSVMFARLRNVSSSGAYVEIKAAPALDSRVLLELGRRPAGARDSGCRVPAHVVRRDEHGIGVEWCEFAPQPVLALITTAWQPGIFEAVEDRTAPQTLLLAHGSRSSKQMDAWPSAAGPARSTAAAHL